MSNFKKGTDVEKTICPKCDPQSPDKFVVKSKFQEHIKKFHIDWGDYTE